MRGAEQEALDALYGLKGLEILQDLASVQVGGIIVLLDIDPDTHPAQDSYYVDGNPQRVEDLMAVAQMVEDKTFGGDFQVTVDNLAEGEDRAVLEEMIENHQRGESTILAMHHPSIVDLGLGMFAVQAGAHKLGHDNLIIDTINNRTTAFLGVEFDEETPVTPVIGILGLYCTKIVLTMTPSERMMESEVGDDPKRLAGLKVHNKRANGLIDQLLAQGGRVLGMGASQTSDRPLVDEPEVMGIAPVGDGTVGIMGHKNAKVVYTYMYRDKNNSLRVRFASSPESVSDNLEEGREQVRGGMERIAYLLGKHSTQPYVYLGSNSQARTQTTLAAA